MGNLLGWSGGRVSRLRCLLVPRCPPPLPEPLPLLLSVKSLRILVELSAAAVAPNSRLLADADNNLPTCSLIAFWMRERVCLPCSSSPRRRHCCVPASVPACLPTDLRLPPPCRRWGLCSRLVLSSSPPSCVGLSLHLLFAAAVRRQRRLTRPSGRPQKHTHTLSLFLPPLAAQAQLLSAHAPSNKSHAHQALLYSTYSVTVTSPSRLPSAFFVEAQRLILCPLPQHCTSFAKATSARRSDPDSDILHTIPDTAL